MRHTTRWMEYRAFCETCGWRHYGQNANTEAGRHCDATGHAVVVDVEGRIYHFKDEVSGNSGMATRLRTSR